MIWLIEELVYDAAIRLCYATLSSIGLAIRKHALSRHTAAMKGVMEGQNALQLDQGLYEELQPAKSPSVPAWKMNLPSDAHSRSLEFYQFD